MTARTRRLGLWYRLGIVLTVLWLLGATVAFAVREHKQWDAMEDGYRDLCIRLAERYPTGDAVGENRKCWDRWEKNRLETDRGPIWLNSFYMAAFLAFVAWVLALIGVYTARWVLAGRKQAGG